MIHLLYKKKKFLNILARMGYDTVEGDAGTLDVTLKTKTSEYTYKMMIDEIDNCITIEKVVQAINEMIR